LYSLGLWLIWRGREGRYAGCGCGGSLVKMALGVSALWLVVGVVVVVVGWDDVQVLCRLLV